MSRLSLAVLLLLGSVTTNTLAAQEVGQNSEPVLRARPIADSAAIRLDGALDEAAWQDGDIASGFRQQEPEEGAPASEPTQIRVLYDHENLYIGVWAFDSRPDRIIARQLERDARLGLSRFGPSGGDDAIELILDTFHDRRNAYYFGTNPQGIQVDGLITDESHEPDLDWDGVWDVRARTTNDGWTAEFAIPLRTLRFPANAGEQTWGFNVQRVVARKNEQSLWTAWSREGEGLHRVSRAGELDGLDSLRRGLDLSVKPYVLTSVGQDYLERPSGSADFEPDVGLDAKLGLASGLVLDVTVNTDFAQVEADEEQVDLSRFSLFFPEKREFFLENAGIFEFGAPHFHGPPPLLLFFSRRIGLQQAQTVPIIAGTRLTGRAGAQTIGLLNVTTAEEESVGAPLTNFAVARVKRDVGQRSYVGALASHRLEEGGADNVVAGVDWNLWLSAPLVLEGFYARTWDSGPGGEDDAWQLTLDYTGDWIGWQVNHLEIGEELDPGIGFVLRRNIARSSGSLRLTPRPAIRRLRKIDIRNSFEYVVNADSRQVLDRSWEISVTPELDSGDEADFELRYQFQRLDEAFELTPGDTAPVIVPAGDYEDWRFEGRVNTSGSRPLAAEVSGGMQGFWGGDRWELGGEISFNSPHIGLELEYSHNDIDVPGGAFTTDLVQARLKLAVNTRLFGNALLQYNSQNRAFSANLRVDFIHRPGSDLFIVFNERRDVEDGRWNPESRAFIVKLTYLRWF